MRLTKREALEICRELWTWLAENPKSEKADWPGWARHGEMNSDCPCCEYESQYVIGEDKDDCPHCPLLKYWPDGCDMDASPFVAWHFTSSDAIRRDAALEIVEFCGKELSKKAKK